MFQLMANVTYIFLTLLLAIFSGQEVSAEVLTQEVAKTHLRWNITTSNKDDIIIEKRSGKVFIKTLNTVLFNGLMQDLKKIKTPKTYFNKINFKGPKEENNVSEIALELVNEEVELFSFFKDREKQYIIDFWVDADEVQSQKSAVKKPIVKAKRVKVEKKIPGLLKKEITRKSVKKAKRIKVVTKKDKPFRDYRYGSAFIWDYPGLSPVFKLPIDIVNKTPEFFYPVKDRAYEKDDKEAHLQLTINLYRKKKYGLMYKSIKLFEKKYGLDDEADLHEYLKAISLLRTNIEKGSRSPLKMAVGMLSNLADRTENYELKKAIYKYLLTNYITNKEYVESLKTAKKFFVTSKENFDYEETSFASTSILFSLSRLNLDEKIQEVLNDRTIQKLLPKHLMLAYQGYVYHRLGDMKSIIKIYEENSKNLAKPVHYSILYNTAEAYFREGKFKKSLKLFDEFLLNYSYFTEAGKARLRIALTYEILAKDEAKTLALYKNAINRTQGLDDSYEAKLRYVALRTVRKKKLDKKDYETRVFLQRDKRHKLNKNLKKLLWLVRLRTYINDQKYKEALSYLMAIPLTSLKPSERRVFEADGAEIVYGILESFYKEANYSKVIKTWSLYKKKYVEKVANDPYMNFIVGQSYLKVGLYEAFDNIYDEFQKLSTTPQRSFPIWVKRRRYNKKKDVVSELNVVKQVRLKNWALAEQALNKLKAERPDYIMSSYYEGIINYQYGYYKKAAKSYENFLSQKKEKILFDPYDLTRLVTEYTDALHQLKLYDKFSRVVDAVILDTKNYGMKNPFVKQMKERLEFLKIEILGGKSSAASYLEMEPVIIKFRQKYPESEYLSRLNYLLGISYVKTDRIEKGKELFKGLLLKEEVSSTIKELVKSELSLLAIKEQSI
jgi:tetratricopeptide (TPR) repeat protein